MLCSEDLVLNAFDLWNIGGGCISILVVKRGGKLSIGPFPGKTDNRKFIQIQNHYQKQEFPAKIKSTINQKTLPSEKLLVSISIPFHFSII